MKTEYIILTLFKDELNTVFMHVFYVKWSFVLQVIEANDWRMGIKGLAVVLLLGD